MALRKRRHYLLDVHGLDKRVAAAGLLDLEFAVLCGIHPKTYSHARNGRSLDLLTLRAIDIGLTRIQAAKGFNKVAVGQGKPTAKEVAGATAYPQQR